MKGIIGIIPLYDDNKESLWLLPHYMNMLEDSHAMPIMLPLTQDKEILAKYFDLCDGILLTGGHDVSPSIYNEIVKPKCGKACLIRDNMESFLLSKAIEEDKPLLGICRGLQLMNAALGGTLYQDLLSEFSKEINHTMKAPYNRLVHNVSVIANTPLADIFVSDTLEVNSYHHQGIKDLSPQLKAMAIAEDGLIEAAYYPNKKFILGVQWHPEHLFGQEEHCTALVQAFVDACKKD